MSGERSGAGRAVCGAPAGAGCCAMSDMPATEAIVAATANRRARTFTLMCTSRLRTADLTSSGDSRRSTLNGVRCDPLSHHVAEFALENLADRAHRKRRHHFQPFGQLEGGDLLRTQMPDQIIEGQRGAWMEHDAGARLLPEDRIGHRDDADLPHLTQSEDQVLDLLAADFL